MRTPSIYFLISIALPTFLFAQHDPGRNSMRLLAEEKTDEAIKLVAKAPKKKNSPIDEAEKSYVLAIAACQKGDAEAAFGHLKHAVENGLAIERVQAASRKLLGPLEDHAKFREWE